MAGLRYVRAIQRSSWSNAGSQVPLGRRKIELLSADDISASHNCVVLSSDTKKPPEVLQTANGQRVCSTGGFFCLQNHELFSAKTPSMADRGQVGAFCHSCA